MRKFAIFETIEVGDKYSSHIFKVLAELTEEEIKCKLGLCDCVDTLNMIYHEKNIKWFNEKLKKVIK